MYHMFEYIDQDDFFLDRMLHESIDNEFTREFKKVKEKAISLGIDKDEITVREIEIHSEISDRVEIIELSYQFTYEILLVELCRRMNIESKIAGYLSSSLVIQLTPQQHCV